MNEKILVTGGTGFTGGHLCRRLASEGRQVRAVVRSPEKAAHLASCGVEVVAGDLKDRESLRRAAEGCETVYHIAAAYRQEGIPDQEFWDVNARGTENIFEASIAGGAGRIVHCSTVGVHGHIANPPADENYPYGPGDIYQESKLAGEKIALGYIRGGKIAGVVFRPAGIYGPGDMRFLKLFRHIKSGRFRMIGNGKARYHLTYIDDLVDGIILCGTKQEAVGNIYILGGEEALTLNEIVSHIAAITGVKVSRLHIPFPPVYAGAFLCEKLCRPFGIEPHIFRRRVDFFRKSRSFDIAKAKRELGFRPGVSVADGLRRTAEWYSAHGFL